MRLKGSDVMWWITLESGNQFGSWMVDGVTSALLMKRLASGLECYWNIELSYLPTSELASARFVLRIKLMSAVQANVPNLATHLIG